MNRQKTFISTYLQLRFSILVVIIVSLISLFSLIPSSFSAEVTLSWDPNTESDLAGYKMYYKTGASGTPYDGTGIDQGGSGINIPLDNLATPDSPSFSLTGLQDNEFYYLVLTAVDSSGNESGYSNEIVYETSSTAVTYVITSSSGPNGSITPAGTTTVTQGVNQTYSISPDANYHIKDVQVDGVSVGPVAEYTFFNVMSTHDIYPTFEADPTIISPTITASCGANGSISPAGSINVASGSDITLSMVPDPNYYIKDVHVDGVSIGAVSAYTFPSVTTDHTITASFDINTHKITASSGLHGSISPTGNVSVVHGGSQTFNITPEAGYHIGQVTVDGAGVILTDSFSFTNVTSNHSISVNFVPNTYTITVSAGDYGSISPVGPVSVERGSSRTFTISADPGYSIVGVIVDGDSVDAATSHTFSNIDADHTISAFFDLENQAPIADAGPDQNIESAVVVSLKGSNSIDLDDGIASFLWEQVSGPFVELLFDPVEPDAIFVSPDVGPNGESLIFRLTTTDYSGASSSNECIVNVIRDNMPPTADAGDDQNVSSGNIVTLDASNSSDMDGGIGTYQWSQISGKPVILSNADSVHAEFVAPIVHPEGSSLKFSLTIADTGTLKARDACIVNVVSQNTPPISDAGPDETVTEGSSVTLDGAGSFDSDDGIVLYLWKQISGTPVTLSDSTAIQPTFTALSATEESAVLELLLTVEDEGGLQSSDICLVSVAPVIQTAPVKIHSGDLDGKKTEARRGSWNAVVTITALDESEQAVDGALATGYWSTGASGSDQCTTGTAGPGQCEIVKRNLKNNVSSVTFAVSDLSGSDFSYDGIANHDPDGDSNGTTIIILKDAIPPSPGDAPMHVGDLNGSSALTSNGNKWIATVNVTVHGDSSDGHQPIRGILVSGSWNGGASGEGSCITDTYGQCSIDKNNLKSNVSSVNFTVNSLSDDSGTYYYEFSENHDTNADSSPSGISIVVDQPL
jgi:hypothetical protein